MSEIRTRLAEIKKPLLDTVHGSVIPNSIVEQLLIQKNWLIDQLEQALARNQEMQRIGSQLALYTDRTDLLEKWNEALQSSAQGKGE